MKNMIRMWGIAALLAVIGFSVAGCSSPTGGSSGKTFTVTFDSGNGSAVPPQTVKSGGKVTEPQNVTRSGGYTLAGWYQEAEFTNQWDFAADTVTANITLYAKWNQIAAGTPELPGTVTISAAGNSFTINTELTATYSGNEPVTYQWNKGGTAISGATSARYTPATEGSYTVTVSAAGYNSKTSAAVTVTASGGVSDIPIANAEISIVAPVNGTPPHTTATGTGEFTIGAVSWSPSDNPFKGGVVYTATVTLTANAGHTFTGLTHPTINGQTANVSNNTGAAVTLSHTFPETDTRIATALTINAQPTKLAYTHGETLDLAGLVVTLTFDDHSSDHVAAADFAEHNITADPAHGDHLVYSTHNGHPVTVEYGDLKVDTGNLTVSLKVTTFTVDAIAAVTYTGSAFTPSVVVKDGTTTLTPDTDYTVAYGSNINAGTATVTITGAGNYAGSTGSASFTINKASGAAVAAPTASTIGATSVTLTAITAPTNGQTVEYARNTANTAPSSGWQSSTTLSGLTGWTTYYFFARAAENANYNAGTASGGTAVTTKQQAILNITFEIIDAAPVIAGPTIYLTSGENKPTTATLTVTDPGQYSSIEWNINGITGRGASFTLNSANQAYNSEGEHRLTLEVVKDGVPYNQTITFTVAE